MQARLRAQGRGRGRPLQPLKLSVYANLTGILGRANIITPRETGLRTTKKPLERDFGENPAAF